MKQAELACRRLELEARESSERATRAEAERDAACHEATMAKLAAEGALSTQGQVESDLLGFSVPWGLQKRLAGRRSSITEPLKKRWPPRGRLARRQKKK